MRDHTPDLADFQASLIRYILLDIRHAKNESGRAWKSAFLLGVTGLM